MNAQLNTPNFQQFVATNKGKSIMFKHADEKNVSTDIIRYVVDVCADYFTFKYDETDAKIAGFYYYTECKMVEEKHPLISVLEKHRFVLIKNHLGQNMIEYVDHGEDRLDGNLLDSNYPKSSVYMPIDTIKEVWAMVDGNFTKVWEVQPQPVAICIQGTDECKAKKIEKQLDPEDEKIIEFLLTHHRGMTVYTKEKVYRDFEYIGSIKAEESTPFSRIIVMGNCNDIQIDIPLSNIHLVVRGQESYERGCKSFFEKQISCGSGY
jgi:hypothetical protein